MTQRMTVISATGPKGFLQWVKSADPHFYNYLSPRLIAQSRRTVLGRLSCRPSGLGRMGQSDPTAFDPTGLTINYTDTLSNPVDQSAPIDFSSVLSTPAQQVVAAGSVPDINVPANSLSIDAASNATTSAASSGFASAVSALANAYTTATRATNTIAANNTLLQANLARAAHGLPPLTVGTSASGLTTVSGTSSLMLLGLGLVGVYFLTRRKAA